MISPLFRRLAWFSVVLVFGVILLGAYTRLSHAGLGCPDWPGCYGEVTWPQHEHEVAAANAAHPDRPVEVHKAWKEMVHRYFAGFLMLTTFVLAALAWRNRAYLPQPKRAVWFAAAFIVFQAALGMWTVTWKLKPIVVMAHLLGGFTTMALLAWTALRCSGVHGGATVRRGLVISALVLLSVQIALGGWTSANYAALACGIDYPQCLGSWWPRTDFQEGFVLWRGIGVDYEGGVLDGPSRAAIHLAHRWFAVLVAGHLLMLALKAMRQPALRDYGRAIGGLLLLQIVLGILNVKLALPLWVATAHNGIAAALLFMLVALLARTTPAPR
ncbi:MAG TPA: COX15/CtaA family protein [Patescibacteria group bacterium]|nr:COX15/CtaA family protein [Patescibacteria group bacterium]